ncbi:MAG: IS91 family transposase [Lachnospiraceae bacterium]
MADRFIQQLFQSYGELFRQKNNLSVIQLKAMAAIENCSAERMGFHRFACESCGHHEIAYNSCQNRHCPHCQWVKQEVWIDEIKSRLLPVKYAHIVFTLPDFLNDFVLLNHKLIYNMLFEASWHAVNKCCLSYLEAQTGALSVLHTWGQNLSLHPHIHMLVPTGGLDSDGMQWIDSAKKFFLPVRALSKIFRARMLFLLRGAIFDKKLTISEKWKDKDVAEELKRLSDQKDWVVHLEKSRLSPTKVVQYLGRYIQRVAISNHRIVSVEGGKVCFHYKDV